VIDCVIPKDSAGVSKRFGFVSMATNSEAVDAKIHLHSTILRDRPLTVKFAEGRDQRRRCRDSHRGE